MSVSSTAVSVSRLGTGLIALAVLLLFAAPAHADLVSRFDTGAEGWATNGNPITYQPNDGNPGGYVEYTANGDGLISFFGSPSSWAGDRRGAMGRFLRFDTRVATVDPSLSLYEVEMFASDGFRLLYDMTVGASPSWQHLDVPIGPASGWTRAADGQPASSADFERVLTNFRGVSIRAEHDRASGSTGLDNVVFELPEAPAPGASSQPTPSVDIRVELRRNPARVLRRGDRVKVFALVRATGKTEQNPTITVTSLRGFKLRRSSVGPFVRCRMICPIDGPLGTRSPAYTVAYYLTFRGGVTRPTFAVRVNTKLADTNTANNVATMRGDKRAKPLPTGPPPRR